jgi:hypothetical protein
MDLIRSRMMAAAPTPSSTSSSIARPVFGALWGLSILGTLRAAEPKPDYPLDTAWRRHAAEHAETLATMCTLLCEGFGFTPDVARVLVADAPWRGRNTNYGPYLEERLVLLELAAMCEVPRERWDELIAIDRQDLTERAALRQFARLVESLLVAQFVAYGSDVPPRLASILSMLGLAAGLYEPPDEHRIRRVFAEWRTLPRERPRHAEDFASWLDRWPDEPANLLQSDRARSHRSL